MRDIVTRIRNNTGSYNIGEYSNDAPYFNFGSHEYISNILNEKDKSEDHYDKLYPFIGLILDIRENRKPRLNTYAELPLNMVLAIGFDKTAGLTNEEREQSSFVDILYPLYEDLLVQMFHSNKFIISEGNSGLDIPHSKTDLYYYDSEEGRNKWSRFVDAIELNINNLRFKNKRITC